MMRINHTKLNIKKLDKKTYSKSLLTNYEITNQFDDADVKLYEGTKDQFKDYKYLSRSNWKDTYPLKPMLMYGKEASNRKQ